MVDKQIEKLITVLQGEFLDYEVRANQPYLKMVVNFFENKNQSKQFNSFTELMDEFWETLFYYIDESFEEINKYKKIFEVFEKNILLADEPEDIQGLILKCASDFGATRIELKKDAKAFKRHFGADCIQERYLKIIDRIERRLKFVCQSIERVFPYYIENKDVHDEKFWENEGWDRKLNKVLSYESDYFHFRKFLLISLNKILVSVPKKIHKIIIGADIRRLISRFAIDDQEDIWVSLEAFYLLSVFDVNLFETLLETRYFSKKNKDDIFLRRKIIIFLGNNINQFPFSYKFINDAKDDSSPFVRQSFYKIAHFLPVEYILETYFERLDTELEPSVRAEGIIALQLLVLMQAIGDECLSYIRKLFKNENEDSFVTLVAIKCCRNFHKKINFENKLQSNKFVGEVITILRHVQDSHPKVSCRRSASMAIEFLWTEKDDERKKVKDILINEIKVLDVGDSIQIHKNRISNLQKLDIFRILSVIAQDGWGFDIREKKDKFLVYKGFNFGFRFWRFWHELRTDRPDKRQAFSHNIGRKYFGDVRVPSSLLGETNPTVVPGEPRFLPSENGWRPFLPLLDDLIPSINPIRPLNKTHMYSSDGITIIHYPKTWFGRVLSFFSISHNFEKIAVLRNWNDKMANEPNHYIETLKNHKVSVKFQPYVYENESTPKDEKVTRFFSSFPILASVHWENFKIYFVSLYRNTLMELSLFTAVLFLYFVIRHYRMNTEMKNNRDSISLVVGGWGSRGKSGTERLKAALFHGIGLEVISKTTGCEAMVVHSLPKGPLKEVFLFRPFDKATIWEQTDVVRIAAGFGANCYLWECMGLTPDYVRTLQEHWMRDDLSTITNAHPDHEDVQGPAGINVAQTMCEFIPRDGFMVTTEDQMRPVLASAARKKNTEFTHVDFVGGGLITPDTQSRFPYAEHPTNISLCMDMAEILGIDRDYALMMMADHIVPDLGVLKSFPEANLLMRRLEFINGMSANERFAAVGNWDRMGLRENTMDKDSHVWITSVINNRADRIPRSQIFATILVEDISPDRCIVIGTNLNGFKSYMEDAWSKHSPTFQIWKSLENGEELAENFLQVCNKLRVYSSESTIWRRLARVWVYLKFEKQVESFKELDGLAHEVEKAYCNGEDKVSKDITYPEINEVFTKNLDLLFSDIKSLINNCDSLGDKEKYVSFLENEILNYKDYSEMKEKVMKLSFPASDNFKKDFAEKLKEWFFRRIILIEDPFASADQINLEIALNSPVGHLGRVIGMQNIKGTGLGFAYSWEDRLMNYNACQKILFGNKAKMEEGFSYLTTRLVFNNLCQEEVLLLLEECRSNSGRYSAYEGQLQKIDEILKKSMKTEDEKEGTKKKTPEWMLSLVDFAEAIYDPIDAVIRRKKCDSIYKDLIDQRISHEKAEKLLKEYVKRQKGGYLKKAMGLI